MKKYSKIKNVVVNFVARVVSIPRKLLHTVRNKIRKIMRIGSKTKKLFKIKKCLKNAQKLQMFSLKIHKGTVIFKKPQNFSKQRY